ncbi:hypothetical protein OG474_32985 [Kribbella sp. NBC_01505]|uniref:hypothetical protein n=1 Tax=Kribbella sp. NBC_01505 TaxID=2903580 RepID=UPI00386C7E61
MNSGKLFRRIAGVVAALLIAATLGAGINHANSAGPVDGRPTSIDATAFNRSPIPGRIRGA